MGYRRFSDMKRTRSVAFSDDCIRAEMPQCQRTNVKYSQVAFSIKLLMNSNFTRNYTIEIVKFWFKIRSAQFLLMINLLKNVVLVATIGRLWKLIRRLISVIQMCVQFVSPIPEIWLFKTSWQLWAGAKKTVTNLL